MARVPLLERSALPEEYRYLLDEDAMGEINLLRAMANNPEVLQSYMRYGTTLWGEGGLDDRDLERCILSVAHELGSEYEWNQHVSIAAELGVPESDIDAIATEDFEPFDARRSALLRYVRAVARGDVDEDTYADVSAHVDERTVIGVTQLAAHYLGTARFLEALDVPLDEPFVGWEAESE